MSDRTLSAAFASFIAAVSLFALASAARAEDKAAAPAKPVRHADLEVGAGVHFGTAKNTPIEDDFYANVGVAVPISADFDGELQVGYWTGNDTNDAQHPQPRSNGPNGATFGLGLRYYLTGEPDGATRFYFATGPSLINNYRNAQDAIPSWTLGPGFRLMLGKQTGLLARVPVQIMLTGEPQPLLLPTLNFFYQF